MALHTYGTMAVDWEERVRMDRLREERLARISGLLAESELGALLCFDMTNIRYITATHIGTWAQDKLNRFCLLPQGDPPIMWDFGSAARHHKLHNPWLGEERSRAGIATLRGAMAPEAGRAEDVAEKIRAELAERDLLSEPIGVDAVELPVLFALQAAGIDVVDGQQLMQRARVLKTVDEITLLNTACMMVDAAYEELYREMRPGMRENECVGLVNKVLYDMGSEFVEGVNAISGERCNPHPHVYTDRALRPGDPAYFDILHSFMGYRTCYYRTFAVASASPALVDAYKRCRYYLDAAIAMIRPGVTTGDVVKLWPKAEEFGFPSEEAAFALQFGHGVGLAIWEKPIFSRLVSIDHPEEIEEGMVFALETFWPASDGWSAARIEEQLVVTKDGCEVITRFPAEDLIVAGKPYYTPGGSLPLEREAQSNLNTRLDPGSQEATPAAPDGAGDGAGQPRLPLGDAGARSSL
jgi:Xaa-Pro aminopeptidase